MHANFNSLGLSINLLVLLGLTHLCLPKARPQTRKFLELSYQNPSSAEYALGWNDSYMVLYWIVLFTGLRASAMEYVLIPFAQWANIEKKKDLTRFAEQAWLLIYYSVFWSIGMVRTIPQILPCACLLTIC
jgi:acyl-CoA-dependent ceramide synthase